VNLLEGFLAVALFALAAALSLYVSYLAVELTKLKYVFEATRHASCEGPPNSSGPLLLSSCVQLYFNGTVVVEVYNVTGSYPYIS